MSREASVHQATIHRVVVPFRSPVRTAGGTWRARASWLLRLSAPGSRSRRAGWGEAVLEDDRDVPVLEALLDELVATGLAPSPSLLARAGAAGRAFEAAYEAAVLDLGDGRRGRSRSRVAVGANALIGAGDPDACAAAAVAALAEGFRTLKVKAAVRDTTATLLARVAAVRAAAGDEARLRLDANGTWSLDEATERLRVLAGLGLEYVEQPLPPRDLAGAAALRARVGVLVAADEAVESPDAAEALLDAEAADVLVVKPARVGGPRAVAAIAERAAARGVPVVVSSLFETGIGLAAALVAAAALPDVEGWPAAERDHGLATADRLEHDLLVEPLQVTRGRVRAPGGRGAGGLGVRVDSAAVERYARPGAEAPA